MSKYQFTAVVSLHEGTYYAAVPELPLCYSCGRTLEAAKQNIQRAIAHRLGAHGDGSDSAIEQEISVTTYLDIALDR